MTEVSSPSFNLSHKDQKEEENLFSWADDAREPAEPAKPPTKWELDVRGLISSKRWLKLHGLKRNQLQLQQILARIGFKHSENYVKPLNKPVGSYYGEGLFHRMKGSTGNSYNITASKETLKDIEKHLKECLHLMRRRQEWLTSGSRKIFGVIQERCVCIVLDVSTMVQSQFEMYIEAVCEMLEDQGTQLAKINLIRAQNDMVEWKERATPVSDVTLDDAKKWVRQLDRMVEISNTCCTEAVVRALEDDTIEAIYLFSEGDVNESSKELLRQKLRECPLPLHAISFNASKPNTVNFLKDMTSETGGRFHAFVVKSAYEDEDDVMNRSNFHLGKSSSSAIPNKLLSQKTRGGLPHGAGVREDVFLIWNEMEKARNILADLQSLIANIVESSTFEVTSEANMDIPSGRGEENFSSKDWLRTNGLNAKRLTIYQALSGFAFRHIDDVIELQRSPRDLTYGDSQQALKLIEAQYCKNFPHIMWKDNQVVHVYVSAELYRNYERKMKNVLGKIQQRIDWLQQGSREVFGTILEDRVYFLIDTSSSMARNLNTVKEKLLQMFQEQIRHKSQFNLVKFDTKATSFNPRLENVDEETLKKAWNWVQSLEAEGSTNTLGALQIALSDPNTEGIYLLTDGRPDQPPHCVLSQIKLRKPVPIHTIAFNCNDIEANEFLQKLGLDSGGRYHCYTTHGGVGMGPLPYESEDVLILKEELKRGKDFLKRMSDLRTQCVKLDWQYNKQSKNKGGKKTPREDTLAIEYNNSDACIPDSPSTGLGMQTQFLLTELHNDHRGKHGRNDLEIMDGMGSYRSISRQSSPRSPSLKKDRKTGKTKSPRPKKGSNKEWLKLNGLVAKKMTLMDALGDTVVRQKTKYIAIINKHVLSRVFEDILPIAHVSDRNKKEIRLINPNAAHLERYEKELNILLEKYRDRLNKQVWDHLPEKEREKYHTDRDAFFYVRSPEYGNQDNMKEIDEIMEENGWPLAKHEIKLLLDEIALGEKYLRLSIDLRAAAATIKKQDDKPTKKPRPKIPTPIHSTVEPTPEPTPPPSPPPSDRDDVQRMLDYLAGKPVLARSEFDGCYYDAILVNCIDRHYSHVRFNHGEQQVTANQYILPCSRNSLPSLRLGDYVLAKTRTTSKEPVHFIPARVIEEPDRRSKFPNHFIIKLYNGKEKRALRPILFKIEKDRYKVTRDFILSRRADIELMFVFGMWISNFRVFIQELCDKYDTNPTTACCFGVDSSSTHSSLPDPARPIPAPPAPAPAPIIKEELDPEKIIGPLQQILDPKLNKLIELCSAQPVVTVSNGTSPMPAPVSKVKETQTSDLLKKKVLSKMSDDGWYYQGLLEKTNKDGTCRIRHTDGTTTIVARSDVLVADENAKYTITAHHRVIGRHPLYQNSYAPAIVESVRKDQFVIVFYDGDKATLPRQEIFYITDAKYEGDVMQIERCEKKWEGEIVIARYDLDGRYYLAVCKRRIQKSRCYTLQWTDGDVGRQYLNHMFGGWSRKRDLSKGDYVLSLRDITEMIYLPGKVLEVHEDSIDIEFYDGTQMEGGDIQRSYYLSKGYYSEAVEYLRKASS